MGQQAIDTSYIDHPRVKDETLESRTYQEVIAAAAVSQNTLVVLPTGLGKTAIGVLVAAHRLEQQPGTKTLVMAPTRPLVEQHRDSFERALKVETGVYEVLTGKTRPEKRAEKWKEVGCFFATPQVVENDVINERVDLSGFSLVVFDEVHRATGDYPYRFIAEQYRKHAEHGRVLGLTASPGSNRKKIEEVADALGIDHFEVRTEDDPDVKPYIQETTTDWIKVTLGDHFNRAKRHFEAAQRKRLKKLKSSGLLDSTANVSKKDLLRLRGKIGKRLKTSDDPALYQGMSHVAACMKVQHVLELLETQGVEPTYRFLEKMKKDTSTKAARSLLEDDDFGNGMAVVEWMYTNGKEHPKLARLKDFLRENLGDGETAIVFSQFRDTVDLLHDALQGVQGVSPVTFKGQKGDVTQKTQLETLDAFRAGEYNVLVSTSVGEEGLDIPAVDHVIFYEPIPSEIRTIQRRGRTGRQEKGVITVFLAEGTRDEAYYWSAKHKEDRMKGIMNELKGGTDQAPAKGQKTLDGFQAGTDDDADGVTIYADDRERKIIKALAKQDVTVRSTRLDVGDFLVSDRTAVERKTASDFVTSIIDNRLFPQLKELTNEFDRPVLIIEGGDIYGQRNVHPNAIRGALAAITLDYNVPILWSNDREETVELLISLAKREQEEQDRSITIRGDRSPTTEKELQAYIVAGLPNVSTKLADRLLDQFGSVKAVFNATETALQDVDGIGTEKAKRIKDIVERRYDG